jgi:hypothetical protein
MGSLQKGIGKLSPSLSVAGQAMTPVPPGVADAQEWMARQQQVIQIKIFDSNVPTKGRSRE